MTKAKIVRPEIMAPLRDAVGFVYSENRDVNTANRLKEMFTAKAFRRNVDQFEVASTHTANALFLFFKAY